jgi:hypothetical protein
VCSSITGKEPTEQLQEGRSGTQISDDNTKDCLFATGELVRIAVQFVEFAERQLCSRVKKATCFR